MTGNRLQNDNNLSDARPTLSFVSSVGSVFVRDLCDSSEDGGGGRNRLPRPIDGHRGCRHQPCGGPRHNRFFNHQGSRCQHANDLRVQGYMTCMYIIVHSQIFKNAVPWCLLHLVVVRGT